MYNAYIVFEDSPAWWTKPFKKDFRHVSLILPLEHDRYVHVDPRHKGIDFKLVTHNDIQAMYDRTLYHDVAIVQYRVEKGINKGYTPSVFTCVELVKRALGIHAWWILTPRQLYHHIRKLKGEKYV